MLWQISVKYSSVNCVLNIWLCNSECVQKNPSILSVLYIKNTIFYSINNAEYSTEGTEGREH